MKGRVGDGKDMWWAFIELFASIVLHKLVIVDIHETIGVDRDDHLTDVGVDLQEVYVYTVHCVQCSGITQGVQHISS